MNFKAWKAMFIFMAFTMGTSMVSPLLPLYQESFSLSKGGTVLIFTIYTLTVLPSMLIFGPLSDQLGRKRVIWPSMVLGIMASGLMVSANSIFVIYVARLIQGLATGAFLGTCTAYVVDLADEEKKLIAAVLAGSSLRLGFGLGPGIAGLMSQYLPYPLQLPFVFHLTLLILGMIIFLTMPETIKNRRFQGISINLGVPAVHKMAIIFFVLPSGFILTVLDATVLSLAPLFINDIMGYRNLAVFGLAAFLVLAAGGVSQAPAAHMQPKKSIIFGAVLGALTLFLFFVSAQVQNVALIVIDCAVIGAANGLILKGGVTMCSLMVPPEERGRLLSTYYFCDYGGMLVPLGIGFLADKTGLFQAMLFLSLTIAFFVGILSLGTSRLLNYKYEEVINQKKLVRPPLN